MPVHAHRHAGNRTARRSAERPSGVAAAPWWRVASSTTPTSKHNGGPNETGHKLACPPSTAARPRLAGVIAVAQYQLKKPDQRAVLERRLRSAEAEAERIQCELAKLDLDGS
jgi:hypothetical protein